MVWLLILDCDLIIKSINNIFLPTIFLYLSSTLLINSFFYYLLNYLKLISNIMNKPFFIK